MTTTDPAIHAAPVASVGGRCAIAGEEFVCEAELSDTWHVHVSCPPHASAERVGLPVIAYLDAIGVVAGVIERTTPSGFVMATTVCEARRTRIQRRLEWLYACEGDATQRRGDRRIVPRRRDTQVRWPDGFIGKAMIVDLSRSGAWLALAERPPVGWSVTVGKRVARVVRHTDDGIAVAFALPFGPQTFDEHAVP